MSKDIHYHNSKGDPEYPHPPPSVEHTWRRPRTPRPWVRQGLLSEWNTRYLSDHIRPTAGKGRVLDPPGMGSYRQASAPHSCARHCRVSTGIGYPRADPRALPVLARLG